MGLHTLFSLGDNKSPQPIAYWRFWVAGGELECELDIDSRPRIMNCMPPKTIACDQILLHETKIDYMQSKIYDLKELHAIKNRLEAYQLPHSGTQSSPLYVYDLCPRSWDRPREKEKEKEEGKRDRLVTHGWRQSEIHAARGIGGWKILCFPGRLLEGSTKMLANLGTRKLYLA